MYVKLIKDIKIGRIKYFKGLVLNLINSMDGVHYLYCGEKIPKSYTSSYHISSGLISISYVFENLLSALDYYKIKNINHLLNNPLYSLKDSYNTYQNSLLIKNLNNSIIEYYMFEEFNYQYKAQSFDSIIQSKTNSTFLHVLKLCFKYIDNNNIIDYIKEGYDGDDLNDIINYLDKKSDLDNNNFKKYLKEFEYQENIDYIIDLINKKLKVIQEDKKIKEPIDKFEKVSDKPKKEILKQRIIAKKKLDDSDYLGFKFIEPLTNRPPLEF